MIDLPDFKNEIKKAYIVGDPEQTPITIDTTNNVRVAHVTRNGPNAIAYTDLPGDRRRHGGTLNLRTDTSVHRPGHGSGNTASMAHTMMCGATIDWPSIRRPRRQSVR